MDETDKFEEQFPGLFEQICLVYYGDIKDERIEISGESIDKHGLQHICNATVTLVDIAVDLKFEDGISAGSLIHWFESHMVK